MLPVSLVVVVALVAMALGTADDFKSRQNITTFHQQQWRQQLYKNNNINIESNFLTENALNCGLQSFTRSKINTVSEQGAPPPAPPLGGAARPPPDPPAGGASRPPQTPRSTNLINVTTEM